MTANEGRAQRPPAGVRAERGASVVRRAWFLFVALVVAAVAACSAESGNEPGSPIGGAGGGSQGGGAGSAAAAGFGTTDPNAGGSSGVFKPDDGSGGAPAPPPGAGGTWTWDGGLYPDAQVVCMEASAPPPPPPPPVNQPVLIDDCKSFDQVTFQSLVAGGNPSGMRILYPYNDTVFPQGLAAPTLQWEQQGNADAVYVHIQSSLFEYHGCFGANAAKRLQIPQNVWDAMELKSGGGGDPFIVDFSVMSGGTAMGPLSFYLTMARGKLQGQLFYNTYTSPQAGENGAVMHLHFGDDRPTPFLTQPPAIPGVPLGPCWSCHSLAANGTVLVAQHHAYPLADVSNPELRSASYDLTTNPGPNPTPIIELQAATNPEFGFSAVYPDGSKLLSTGSPTPTAAGQAFPDGLGNVPAMIGGRVSELVDTRTGQRLNMPGWTVEHAMMPSFSPDGTKLVFNWYDAGQGHALGVADFDSATNGVSNVREIFRHDTLFPGWPWVTPDGNEIIFVLGNTPDFVSSYPNSANGALDANPNRPALAASDLWIVNIDTGDARPLLRANGYNQAGAATYLPRPVVDEHKEFFPTISPVASGGYFWVFFTSRRSYGNTIFYPDDFSNGLARDSKKIWVTAINISVDGTPITDPSHPPFLLPGQEIEAGNIRAFAALEPCRQDGSDCESGVDCCGGQCSDGKCGPPEPPPPPPPPPPNCTVVPPPPPPPPVCREINESCTTKADCCDEAAECIAGFCQIPEPIRPPR